MRGVAVALTVIVAALLWPAKAEAGTPVLVSVGHRDGHLTAAWTLPEYTEVWGIKASTQPRTASNGDFFEEDIVLNDLFSGNQRFSTSYVSSEKLNPGIYFVKVYGYDNICFHVPFDDPRECGVVYSNALSATVTYAPLWRLTVRRLGRTMIQATLANLRGSLLYDPIRPFRVCWTRRAMRPACKSGKFIGAPAATFIPVTARLPNVVTVTVYVEGKLVASKRLRVR